MSRLRAALFCLSPPRPLSPSPPLTTLALVALLWLTANPARALEIEQVTWGFDGQVVSYRFNVLSVLVSNPTPEPFDGALELVRTNGARSRVGARLVEPVFVAPFAQRWVQFYPYVMYGGPYTLAWGRRSDKRYEVPSPRHGAPARIILADPSGVRSPRGGLKAFPDNLFPPTVAATDALQLVALDHVPRWEAPRRQAFLDWIHAGGVVHVFQNAGRFPEFPADLAVLNAPVDKQHVGAGVVHRHARDLGDLDRDFVQRVLLEQAAPADGSGAEDDRSDPTYTPYGDWDLDSNFFSALKTMTRPDHNWALLHALSLVYLALIFPGMYFLGGRRADYRVVFAATLGLVGVFSWAFSVVGRRGYDETTTVNSVAIARPLADGAYDVTGWSNAFVTRGDFYTIAHAGAGRLYSTCQNIEAVNGVVQNGLDGVFRVDIPPYSSRPFGYRARLPAEPLQLRIESVEVGGPSIPEQLARHAAEKGMKAVPPEVAIEPDELQIRTRLDKLVVAADERFLQNVSTAHALYGRRIYSLVRQNGRLTLAGGGQALTEFLPLQQYESHSRFGLYYDPWTGQHIGSPDDVFGTLGTPLIARSLGLTNQQTATNFSLPEDRIRLFLYAPMPETFFLRNNELGQQAGYVLYVLDLPLDSEP